MTPITGSGPSSPSRSGPSAMTNGAPSRTTRAASAFSASRMRSCNRSIGAFGSVDASTDGSNSRVAPPQGTRARSGTTPPPRITARQTRCAWKVARPSLRTAPTANEPSRPCTRRSPSSASNRSSTRRTPSTNHIGPARTVEERTGCDQSLVSTDGSARGSGLSSKVGSNPMPNSGVHGSALSTTIRGTGYGRAMTRPGRDPDRRGRPRSGGTLDRGWRVGEFESV